MDNENYGFFAPQTIHSRELPPTNVTNDVGNNAVLPLTVMQYVKLFNVWYCVVYLK